MAFASTRGSVPCRPRASGQPRKFQLYLQFDGAQLEGQHSLRGRLARDATAEHRTLSRNPFAITLAMTVTPENLPFLWQAIEFASNPPRRGISFQPMFQSGRILPNGGPRRA